MKKVIMILAAALCMSLAASAQPKAIGIRGLFNLAQISYEHTLGGANFLEADLGGTNYGGHFGFDVTGTYNFMLVQPAWTAGTWGVYAGPGVTLGQYSFTENDATKTEFYFGIVGQVGLEYTFNIPLQLAADLRPVFGIGGYGVRFFPTIACRYAF